MSKRRNLRLKSNSSIFNASLDDKKLKNSFFGTDTIKSAYIPEVRFNKSLANADLTQFKKQTLYNKNISYFRQSFNPNDTSQLPFMSSLRRTNKINPASKDAKSQTISRPFDVAEKATANTKVKKKIADIAGKSMRMTNAYYRWHNGSGLHNKQSTEFECFLRDYNRSWNRNPEEENFDNRIRPIKYKDTEQKIFTKKDLICPRQKRLFKLTD